MTFTTPTLVELVILALASYRIFRLLGRDSITERPRVWLTGETDEGNRTGARRPMWIADLVACPFCLGWWISLALVAAWWAWPMAAIAFALPWAVSALAALVTVRLDPS